MSLLRELDDIAISIDGETAAAAWSATWRLARQHRFIIDDTSYLALALRRRRPLATLDAALARAATAEGVTALP